MFNAGAGNIGQYDSCSFNLEGKGTFRALEGSNPYVGLIGMSMRGRDSDRGCLSELEADADY
jgi:hypothetical protein